ncbi:FecCD family ABC transporter permease [Brevibacterium litoralis]|uniref:FecCD family ABC transporter permease n=1 Tax=Brevibacterium litoralis TaxID=3138935 RepID=UPI0032ED5F18
MLLGASGVTGLFAGSKVTGFGEVWAVLTGGGDAYIRQVVDTRIPRTVVGMVVGGALAVSGVVIQGITRNPLGEPGLLGVGVGASASVVTATAFFGFTGAATSAATVWVALPGAVAAVLVVIVLGRRSGSDSVVPLVLAGAVVTAVLTAYVNAVVLSDPMTFDSYRYWVVGSLAGANFPGLAAAAPALALGGLAAVVLARSLDVLALGDAQATALGIPVRWVRIGGIAAATLLAAAATAVTGPIGFVGLAVPHVLRPLLGADHRWLVPASFLGGGVMLVVADIVARTVLRPAELLVGIVTAFVGAPFLLWALRRGAAGGGER